MSTATKPHRLLIVILPLLGLLCGAAHDRPATWNLPSGWDALADACHVSALVQAATQSRSSVLYVDDDAADPFGDGLSWDSPFDNLQLALTVARQSGGAINEIHVAGGTYTPVPPGGAQ